MYAWTHTRTRRKAALLAAAGVVGACLLAVGRGGEAPGFGARVWALMAPAPVLARGEVIRVRVVRGADRVDVSGTGLVVQRGSDRLGLASPVEFCVLDDRLVALCEGQGVDLGAAGDGADAAEPLRVTSFGGLRVDGRAVGHEVTVLASRSGRVDVVAHVDLESYVAGVVASELYRGWPDDAFAAQAVAARSYALHERALARGGAGRAWDIEGDTSRQAFTGLSSEAQAVRAARETRGIVLSEGGEVLRAYYASTCGGRSAGAAEHWPKDAGREFNASPALQGFAFACPCEDSPRYRWDRRLRKVELEARLRAWGARQGHAVREIEVLRTIRVWARNAQGRPTRFRVVDGAGGSFELSAEEMRLACNTVAPAETVLLSVSEVTEDVADEVEEAPPPRTVAYSTDLAFEFGGEDVVIRGRGFGHGVGLCQFGARGMAAQGAGWAEILEAYYPGADLAHRSMRR